MTSLRSPGPTILVTGGLGYIGSHTVVALDHAGYRVVIVDNLSNSDLSVLPRLQALCDFPLEFERADVRDSEALGDLLGRRKVKACLHFAGLKAVAESMAQPLDYYEVNVAGTLNLLKALIERDVYKFVFSSSATVYGNPSAVPIDESQPECPVNPYGRSKWMAEQILQDACDSDARLAVIALRYFNPAGAHGSGCLGERPNGTPNNLMPYISQVASGKRAQVDVFGADYPTPDGTGVRDYVHVSDLSQAHVLALRKLSGTPGYHALNLGTGVGYSVLDVLRAYQEATGCAVPYRLAPRRAGDVATCYADPGFARVYLGWESKNNLVDMCRDAWKFETAMDALN